MADIKRAYALKKGDVVLHDGVGKIIENLTSTNEFVNVKFKNFTNTVRYAKNSKVIIYG